MIQSAPSLAAMREAYRWLSGHPEAYPNGAEWLDECLKLLALIREAEAAE